MSIIKIGKRSRYTVIDNTVINNKDLDYPELGLLTYLLSKPPTWEVSVLHLAHQKKAGKAKISSMLKNLQVLGYAHFKRFASGKGEWTIYEKPYTENQHEEKPHTEKPDQDKPDLANRTQVSTETIVNTEKEIKEVFDFWKTTFKNTSAVLDKVRIKSIEDALINYSVDDLKKAVVGCSKSDFHVNQGYTGIGNIFKSADQIEKFKGPGKAADKPKADIPNAEMVMRQLNHRLYNKSPDPFTHPLVQEVFNLVACMIRANKFNSKDHLFEYANEMYLEKMENYS